MALLTASSKGRGIGKRLARPGAASLLVALLLAGLNSPARAETSAEYRLKAAFLFNFAQFVKWPPRAFPQPQTPLVIGILGDDPFGSGLDEIVRGEQVNSRPLAVQRYRSLEEIKICHVLFISRSEADRAAQIVSSLKGRGVLTVGDAEGAAMRGIMIRFATENNKIRLKINLEAAKGSELTISSKLLRLADLVAP